MNLRIYIGKIDGSFDEISSFINKKNIRRDIRAKTEPSPKVNYCFHSAFYSFS